MVGYQGCDGFFVFHGLVELFSHIYHLVCDPRFICPPTVTPAKALMPSHMLLQQLCLLDRSSSKFHDQVSDILYGEGYRECASSLQGNDLVWLIDYLDEVCCHITTPTLCLRQYRLSIVSTLPVPVSGNVYASSEASAALTRYFRHPTCFQVLSRVLAASPSLQKVPAMCTRGSSTVQRSP